MRKQDVAASSRKKNIRTTLVVPSSFNLATVGGVCHCWQVRYSHKRVNLPTFSPNHQTYNCLTLSKMFCVDLGPGWMDGWTSRGTNVLVAMHKLNYPINYHHNLFYLCHPFFPTVPWNMFNWWGNSLAHLLLWAQVSAGITITARWIAITIQYTFQQAYCIS